MNTPAHPEPTGILRPSSAPRWVPCPGSHALEALYPEDTESPEAREGTAAHFYAAEALAGRVHIVGALAPNGHPIDQAMHDAGAVFVDDARAELAAMSPAGAVMRIEQKLTMHALVHPLNEGTPDLFLIDPPRRRIVLWDYKYGHGFVDEYGNWQLVDYFAGLLEAYGYSLADVAEWTVCFRIVQPRFYGPRGSVREWTTTGAALAPYVAKLAAAAAEAKQPGAWLNTGDHCDDCQARAACPVLQKVAAKAMDKSGRGVPVDLPPHALGLELKWLDVAIDRMEARRSGLNEIALAALRRGETVPFWGIGHADTRERWNSPTAVVLAMGQMMGHDLKKADEPITPAGARKLGIDAAVIAEYAIKPQGAAKVVPVDDTAAARAFGNNQGTK
jgi:hypothetical protein